MPRYLIHKSQDNLDVMNLGSCIELSKSLERARTIETKLVMEYNPRSGEYYVFIDSESEGIWTYIKGYQIGSRDQIVKVD